MRRTVVKGLVAALLAALLAAVWPAWAQQGPGPQGRRGMDRPMPQHPMPPPDRGWQGRPGDAQGEHRRGPMMSPEERRQLRRDISNHGRDIYREPRDERPRQP
jgi:hypothetical protein